jgi:TrmH family RNA methyltransferase
VAASFEPITRLKHPALQRARALQTPAGRAQSQHFLIEGEAMLRQALGASAGLADAFFLERVAVDASVSPALAAASVNCYTLGRGLMTKILGTGYDTSITAIGVVPMRVAELDAVAGAGGPLLACERIQDPRNVGVLLRTAEAGGACAMLLSDDSADPFSRAAVRSTTGSILRLPLVLSQDLARDLARLRDAGLRLIASSRRAPTSIWDAGLDRRCVVIVGNESEGISSQVRELADDVVAIPVAGGASSFNVTVAAAILLYECARRERKNR